MKCSFYSYNDGIANEYEKHIHWSKNESDVIYFEGFAVAKEYLETTEKFHFIKYPKSENLTEEQIKFVKNNSNNEITLFDIMFYLGKITSNGN